MKTISRTIFIIFCLLLSFRVVGGTLADLPDIASPRKCHTRVEIVFYTPEYTQIQASSRDELLVALGQRRRGVINDYRYLLLDRDGACLDRFQHNEKKDGAPALVVITADGSEKIFMTRVDDALSVFYALILFPLLPTGIPSQPRPPLTSH